MKGVFFVAKSGKISEENVTNMTKGMVMADFELNEEQTAIRDTARDFARNELMPNAAKYDQSMEYPWDVVKKAHENGLLNLNVPADLGGLGLDNLTICMVVEELAYGCSGIATAMMGNDLSIGPVLLAGSKELK